MKKWIEYYSRTCLDGEKSIMVKNMGKVISVSRFKSGRFNDKLRIVKTDKITLKRNQRTSGIIITKNYLSQWREFKNGSYVDQWGTFTIVKKKPVIMSFNYLAFPILTNNKKKNKEMILAADYLVKRGYWTYKKYCKAFGFIFVKKTKKTRKRRREQDALDTREKKRVNRG